VEDTPSKICDKDSNASFEVTYITPETKEIHQLKAEFDKNGLLEGINNSFNKLLKFKMCKENGVKPIYKKKNAEEECFSFRFCSLIYLVPNLFYL
jgi:hypothetical protein